MAHFPTESLDLCISVAVFAEMSLRQSESLHLLGRGLQAGFSRTFRLSHLGSRCRLASAVQRTKPRR